MDKLMRISTPTITYIVDDEDFDISRVSESHMIISNVGGGHKIIRENPTIGTENKSFSTELTQEETKAFSVGTIEVQVHIKLDNDKVLWTEIVKTSIGRVLEENIL